VTVVVDEEDEDPEQPASASVKAQMAHTAQRSAQGLERGLNSLFMTHDS
jgi:hypothetical protein